MRTDRDGGAVVWCRQSEVGTAESQHAAVLSLTVSVSYW